MKTKICALRVCMRHVFSSANELRRLICYTVTWKRMLTSRSLTEITIPAGVTEVGRGAFVVCYNLVIRCYEGSAADAYAQENGFAVAYITADSIAYDVLPADLVEIGAEAFLNCQLGSVRLPEGVTTIGGSAFKGSSLAYICIPATVVSIAEDAFEGCEGLVIVGMAGSYVQEYAQTHRFAFIAQE